MPYKDEKEQKAAQHRSYLRNKAKVREASKQGWYKRHAAIVALKDKPCLDCGGSFISAVMDFHHRNPKEKKESLGRLERSASMQAILEEIAKCDLLCSNCHRIRHATKADARIELASSAYETE